MGTNYYAVRNRPTIERPIHIGKASAGWLFHFQRQNDLWHEPPIVWNTYNQVKNWLKEYTVDSDNYVIINEYDEIIPFDEFCKEVDWRQNEEEYRNNPDNFSYKTMNVDGYRFSDNDFSQRGKFMDKYQSGDVYYNPVFCDLWVVDNDKFLKINDWYEMDLDDPEGFIKVGHIDSW